MREPGSSRQHHTAPGLGHMEGNLQGIGGSQFGYGHLLLIWASLELRCKARPQQCPDAKRGLGPERDHPGEQSEEPRGTLDPQRTSNSQIVGRTHTHNPQKVQRAGSAWRMSLGSLLTLESLSHRWLDWCLESPSFEQSPHILLSAISFCV